MSPTHARMRTRYSHRVTAVEIAMPFMKFGMSWSKLVPASQIRDTYRWLERQPAIIRYEEP